MLWGRDGAHNVLQIRASVFSNLWDDDWEKAESEIYKKGSLAVMDGDAFKINFGNASI
jgi:hypothetical protein